MLRGAGIPLRGRRLHLVVLFLLAVSFFALLQLPGKRDVRILPDTRPHKGLLVTTSNDERHPLHYLPIRSIGNNSVGFGDAVPVRTGISPGSKQGVSHIVRHPSKDDLVYITNEIRPGSIWTGKIGQTSAGLELGIFGQNPSKGDLPAHSLVTKDGRHLLVSNYGSPTISVHSISSDGRLRHVQTLTLPRPEGVDLDTLPHPHHIAQHPSDSIFYVPDLGWNVIYALKQSRDSDSFELSVEQTFEVKAYGDGPRNGVVSADGRTYHLSFQTSSSVIPIPLDRRRLLRAPSNPAVPTLPADIIQEGTITTDGQTKHSASDIHLFDDLLLVANRRVIGPYPAFTGENEDTVAVFHTSNGRLTPRGQVRTGCWKPREMTRIRGERKDYLAVTCNGQFAQGGGVVLVDLSEPYRVIARWDSGQSSPSGIAGLSLDLGIDSA